MKPEFMRLRRALAGTVATLLLAAGLVVLSPAISASAHHNTIDVSASCNNYVWTITWTITNSEWDKDEKITWSSDSSIIAMGTTIAAGATFTTTETVSTPTTKTLDISAEWSNGVTHSASKTIYPKDFTGTCTTVPTVDLVAQPCVTGGSPGAVTATLGNLQSGAAYRIALLNSADVELETLSLTAAATTFSTAFSGHGPGEYSVAVYDSTGALLVESASATILGCTAELKVAVELVSCTAPQLGTDRAVNVTVTGLAASTPYTVRLVTTATPAVEIATTTIPSGAAAPFTHTFIGVPSPGDYKVEVVGGLTTVVSDTVTAGDCDLDTLAPPSIELLVVQCDGVNSTAGALSARMIDLDATRTYYVRLVDGAGDTVPGGEDQTVTGSTTATVTFPDVTAPGTYTAQLLIDPGKQLAATSGSSVDLAMCLPTLAMTGPGVLLPLGSVAALLLTLGGAVVMGRLRRRMAL